ncbi:hypothetical protein Y032_0463g1909 [Ancylostoma ceylanicum]|uniref:Reverse transcriptase domain-containing protein n=1 Tax=Ancylostoma ceylanicum TaxID=53326 RepID=A0A016WXH9_9BILA|nr:hypothetical protein Y032_0463g1909 [Ancylostoma ceylanicum]
MPATGRSDRPAEEHPTSHHMIMTSNGFEKKATASTGVDAHSRGPVSVKNMRGSSVLRERRHRGASRRVVEDFNVTKTRIATLNVGTLTGRSYELAAALQRRRIDLCAVQETRWSGSKSKDIGCGFKIVYTGSKGTRNGVGIIVSERFRDSIAGVERFDDRLMKIVIVTLERRIHFFSAYAPQSGCSDNVKNDFWALIDEKTAAVPSEDTVIIAGDLNGHVGVTNDGYRCHGGFGYGVRNDDGERILDYAESHNLIIANTKFRKRPSHLVSFYSGSNKTQIDYVLVRYQDQKLVTDAKVVPYETVTSQHRPLICTMKITPPNQKRAERCGPARIKWWRLREKEADVTSLIQLPPITNVDETWQRATDNILAAARSELSTTKPDRRKIDRKTWLWTEEVRTKVREKKRLYHLFLDNKTEDNWRSYREAKRSAKKAVAAAKAAHYDEVCKKLDSKDGERFIYRLAKSRQRQADDVEKFHGVNDEQGLLLMDRKMVMQRWRDYFEKVSTEEFAHPPVPEVPPTFGPVQPITIEETLAALKRMKAGKATGPDDMAAEVWKSQCWSPADWLTKFFNLVIAQKKVPMDWQQSTTIPIWKGKGNPADCTNYRPIRLLSHTMKIFERIIDRRIREIVQLSSNQCGFVPGCGTTDAIHAARLLIEKHREKKKPLHLAFLDLEKAFDRVPHEVIWYALRLQGIPEELLKWVQMLYVDHRSKVQAAAGTSTEFPITVGVHQGSALSPLLFIVVMDALTKDLQRPAPWTLLYADDVMLASEDKDELERQTQAWSDRLARFGLRLNIKKTEYLTTDEHESGTIKINGTDLPRAATFKYLGSMVSSDGSLAHEISARVNATWLKWRSLTGVLCDKNIPDRLKSKIYRTVVRPVAIYGAECWPATKEMERRISVMEMRMLRWMGGITQLDRICNQDIRQRFGVVAIDDKLREARLRWFGHVLRAKGDKVCRIGYDLEVPGKRPKGRPKQRWLDTLHADLKLARIHPDQAHDRAIWRQRISKADPATKREKR